MIKNLKETEMKSDESDNMESLFAKPYRRIKEFAKVRRGASPRPISDPKYFGGEVGWVRISDVTASKKYLRKTTQYISQLGESLSLKLDPGHLIMSICATIGKPIILSIPACIHDGFVWIYDHPDADTEYLYYYLQFIEEKLKSVGQSGTQVNLNIGIVKEIDVFFPAKNEQTAIAEKLSVIDQVIDQTEGLIIKYQRIKSGLMHDLLTKGIDEKGNLRTEKSHKFKDSPVGRIPEEWNSVNLGAEKLFSLATGGTPSTSKSEYWIGGNIPWLSSGEIHKKTIRHSNSFITKLGYENSNARFFPINSILIALAGQGKTRGTVAITEIETTSNQSIAAIIPNEEYIEPYYLYYQLDTMYEELRSISSGAGRAGLSLRIIREIPVKLPSKEEQKKIVEILLKVDDIINKERESLNKTLLMKNGLMQDLLTGKVRVPYRVNNE